jgi:hypothetical protein
LVGATGLQPVLNNSFKEEHAMAQHGAREQKKLAKKRAKQNQKKRQLARQTSDNPAIRFKGCEAWPVHGCYEPEGLWEEGLGNLVIARKAPTGELIVGSYLVDVFCLGVKDAFWRAMSAEEFKSIKPKFEIRSPLRSISPERLAKIVTSAVEFAQRFGFPPHTDFRHVGLLLHGIDANACADELAFGKEGKPFYIQGPYESLPRAQAIVKLVNAAGGHFVIPMNDGRFEEEGRMFGPDDDLLLDGEAGLEPTQGFDPSEGDYLDVDEAPRPTS